jgi:choice-of-anchor B domain-containing protein
MDAINGNDVWGWVDTQEAREYALMGLTDGTAFVDLTDPEDPVFLGKLPTQTVPSPWRDIKVYADHAFVVADGAGAHGMQVFDLKRLRGVTAPQEFVPDAVYGDFNNAHNLSINEATGFAYVVGTNTCAEGLHIVNINDPLNPVFANCHDFIDTHDTQCVSYVGPDIDYQGDEICFSSSNFDFADGARLEIAQVTGQLPTTLSTVPYPDSGFAHQGWLTEDHRFFLLGDETDELNLVAPTRTHVFDVTNLDAPQYVFTYEATTTAIDHNMYVVGNRVYQANYTSGLRVLEFGDLGNGEMSEIAFFDTFPDNDNAEFDGAWSVYPFLPSGNIIVSDITNGMFVLTAPL